MKDSLTTPNGRRVGFTFQPEPQGGVLGTLWRPRFVADAGVFDILTVDDVPLSQMADGRFGLYAFGLPYNPSAYTLTTKDGVAYKIDQWQGLRSITDRNGNTLTFTREGITSSAGPAVTFQRDELGRITSITDPDGGALRYDYDARGDLVTSTDQAGLVTHFRYETDPAHFLRSYADDCGCHPVVRIQYNDDGRVTSLSDDLGNVTRQTFDLDDFTVTTTNPLGHATTVTHDERGNVVRVINPLGHAVSSEYDADNNFVSVTDARGHTTRMTHDERGNLLTITNALGETRVFTYTPLGQTRHRHRSARSHHPLSL